MASIHPRLQPKEIDADDLRALRNSFRRDRDYSILYFFVAWGLNVVDATVFGHLKDFDVSPDLTLHVRPAINTSYTGTSTGLAMVLSVKSPAKNHINTLP